MKKNKPILLSSLPRSGSTWTAKVLSKAKEAFFIHEPDNEHLYARALFFKENLHRYPYLTKKDNDHLYFQLWKDIFENRSYRELFPDKYHLNIYPTEKYLDDKSGAKMDPFFKYNDNDSKDKILNKDLDFKKRNNSDQRLVVKSVYNILALDWLDYNFDFVPVIIIRHPGNMISSYLNLKFSDSYRNIFSQKKLVKKHFKNVISDVNNYGDVIEKMTAQIAGAYSVIEKQMKKHKSWHVIRHEDLCKDPIKEFKKLYKITGLSWSHEVENFILESDKPGEGYKTNRVASNQIDKYKSILSVEQMEKIRKVYDKFGNPFYDNF